MSPQGCGCTADAQDEHACDQQDSLGSSHTSSHLHHLTALHTRGLHSARLFLLSLGGKIFNDFAETLDSGRIVDLLTEHHGGERNADGLSVENFVCIHEKLAVLVGIVFPS